MRQENVQAVIQALYAYAEAAQGEYSSLDGNDIQQDMWKIANVLESAETCTVEELLRKLEITKTDFGYEWEQYQ
ncbi:MULTISPECIES: hypothetical protein [Corynebacterium]|uniref:hypothetical protein n=1 Tax=Corynebacterium TaxID=1716 RepID=UPI000A3CA253|nr:hypothetical protein [Corynebacterium kefirresidentii]OUJ22347.1 hypothetical protein CBI45_09170 [Corynebacterium kefirresidentii]